MATALFGQAIAGGQTLSWTSDNAAGSLIGATATTGRPFGAYIGTELVVGTDPQNALIAGNTFAARIAKGMLVEVDSTHAFSTVSYGTSSSTVIGVRFGGSKGAETALATGATITNHVSAGYDGTAIGVGSQTLYATTEAWAVGAHGAGVSWLTITNGTTSGVTRWSIIHNGTLRPGNLSGSVTGDNLYDLGATTSRPSTVYGYTGNFTTAVTSASLTATSALVLTGATVTGTPTWSSNQAITLSTAAQPNITSVGTLTSLAVGAITSTGDITTTSDDIAAGFGATTGATGAFLTLKAGTNSGANNQNSAVRYYRSSTELWKHGVLGDKSTDGALRFHDVSGNIVSLTIASGAFARVLIGSDFTSNNLSSSLVVNAGDHGGANDKDSSIEWQRGGVSRWLAGVLGATVGANTNWTLWDDVNNAAVITATPAGGIQIGAPTGGDTGAGTLNLDNALYRDGTQVVGAQGAAVADASGGVVIDAEARTALNSLLARLRTHGLIAT